ncbi:MAG: GNAT family N-acetyltransferase [Planctomycetes bacterium]|nr:GNAT family N-acetyltransferase [Planctomycetota bacterium]
MDNRDRYRDLAKAAEQIPVFSQPWWLDAVCGKNCWDVVLAETNGQITGALPLYRSRRMFFDAITMPPFTQNFHLWLSYPNSQKSEKRLSYEKSVITELIEGLAPFDYFAMNLYHALTNWLPFHWKGFTQSTRYTYVIESLADLDAVFQRFSHAKRKNIKRAEKTLSLGPELTASEFYDHHVLTLGKQGDRVHYSLPLLESILEAAYSRDRGKVFTAVDRQNRMHAAIFVVWDERQAYYLISSIDPEYRASGAATFLIKQAIIHVSSRTRQFDFEGSMNEGIENSFRQFGTIQKPYFRISQTRSRLLQFRQFLRNVA